MPGESTGEIFIFYMYINYYQEGLIHTLIWNFNLWVQEQRMIFIRVLEQPLLVEQQPFVRIEKTKKKTRERERCLVLYCTIV